MMTWYLLIPILLPLVGACFVPFMRAARERAQLLGALFAVELVCTALAAWKCSGTLVLFTVGGFEFALLADGMGKFFAVITAAMFAAAGIFGFEYLSGDEHPRRYHIFYLLTLFALEGLAFSANLFTFYLFYELMTFLSMPLVLHEGTDKARRAAFKYLGYSLLGACLALFGFVFADRFCSTLDFVPGGSLNFLALSSHTGLALAAAFCMLLGFACKAGLLPLHAWLPIAHPEAPAPASAVLSGVITKGGVLGIIRVAYYVFGASFLRGTWVQTTLLVLALCTVFMGSMLAYKEQLLKRRLAYSTVSQVSYVLFGLFLFCEAGLTGALLQVVFHALAKVCLFLCAGALIHYTHRTRVPDFKGIGRQMPWVMWCFALAGLSLVGIPPLGGFVSKWYLAEGGLTQLGVLGGSLGAGVLLISALLTAGYLLGIVRDAFFPGAAFQEEELAAKPGWAMKLPLAVLAAALVVLGLWPTGLVSLIGGFAAAIL